MKSFWRFEEIKISKPVDRLVLLQQICLVQSDLHVLVSEPKWSPKVVDTGGSCCIRIWTWCCCKLGRGTTFDLGRQREFYHHLLQQHRCCRRRRRLLVSGKQRNRDLSQQRENRRRGFCIFLRKGRGTIEDLI